MALWKDAGVRDPATPVRDPVTPPRESAPAAEASPPTSAPAPQPRAEAKESVIAAGLTLEGKIEGSGHVRLAGRSVIVGGELEGNIIGAGRVELQQNGVINGDVVAASLTVAAGSRMRGRVEFGWSEAVAIKAAERRSTSPS